MRALADAMSARYGLPAAELMTRLARGRFRVKSNVDRATAQIYVRDLEALGARVRIEPASPDVSGDRTDSPTPRRTSPAIVQRAGTPTRDTATPWRSGPSLVPVQRDAPSPPAQPAPRDVLPPAQPRGPKPQLMSVPTAPELLPVGATLPEDGEPPLEPPGRRATRPSLPPQPVRPTTSPLPANVPTRATRPSLPPQAMRPTTSPLPAHLASRPQTPSLPPQQEARPKRSSLQIPVLGDADLGDGELSLGALDGGQLSLTSLDGRADPAPADGERFPASIGPPRPSNERAPANAGPGHASGDRFPASIGPAARPGAPARATGTPARAQAPQPRPDDADRFAPPGAEEAELVVELAQDERERQDRKRLSTPPAMAAERRDEPAPRTSSPALPSRTSSPLIDPTRGPGRGRSDALSGHAGAAASGHIGASASATAAGGATTGASASAMRASSATIGASASATRASGATTGAGASAMGANGATTGASGAMFGGAAIGAGGAAIGAGGAGGAAHEPVGASPLLARLAAPRMRLAAGVLLAILLGFAPASIIASLREHRADHAIDAVVTSAQVAADSADSYAALDALRAEQLRAKQHAHRMIALTSLLIWAAASSGLAYVWFRRVPWDRWA